MLRLRSRRSLKLYFAWRVSKERYKEMNRLSDQVRGYKFTYPARVQHLTINGKWYDPEK